MAADYEVIAQKQSTSLAASGGFQDVMNVTFKTVPGGVQGTISVPLTQYNAENVKALIEARVKSINDVGSL
jgi:vacuolar-type H+-ATPase subunit C/Vma6